MSHRCTLHQDWLRRFQCDFVVNQVLPLHILAFVTPCYMLCLAHSFALDLACFLFFAADDIGKEAAKEK